MGVPGRAHNGNTLRYPIVFGVICPNVVLIARPVVDQDRIGK